MKHHPVGYTSCGQKRDNAFSRIDSIPFPRHSDLFHDPVLNIVSGCRLGYFTRSVVFTETTHGCDFIGEGRAVGGRDGQWARTIDDLNGLFRSMMKAALERMLDTEMDVHLGRRKFMADPAAAVEAKSSNRRNGRSKKTVRGDLGPVTVQTPRDRGRHLRAAGDRQAPASGAGLRREDSGPLREGDDDPRHRGHGEAVVWGRGVAKPDNRRSLRTSMRR